MLTEIPAKQLRDLLYEHNGFWLNEKLRRKLEFLIYQHDIDSSPARIMHALDLLNWAIPVGAEHTRLGIPESGKPLSRSSTPWRRLYYKDRKSRRGCSC